MYVLNIKKSFFFLKNQVIDAMQYHFYEVHRVHAHNSLAAFITIDLACELDWSIESCMPLESQG